MHDAMSAELARSGFAREALEESTATLRDLAGRYDALDGLLAGSRELLGTLLRSQKSDTWYLETAFYVLAATLAWLVFRRWIYGPAWWLVWLPFRTLWRFTAAGVGGSVDAVGGRGAGGKLDGSSITSGGSAVTASMQAHGAPTIQARAQATAAEATADGDSMVEKVGKIVDGAADTYGATEDGSQENTGGDQPNPKKRMWEEPIEEAKQMERESETEREKDEL